MSDENLENDLFLSKQLINNGNINLQLFLKH
jgi:hypothetical protein